jgi:hypothetical protein
MSILLLKLKNGKVIKGKAVLHFQLAEAMGIDFDDIVDVGFVSHDRYIWCNRKPH